MRDEIFGECRCGLVQGAGEKNVVEHDSIGRYHSSVVRSLVAAMVIVILAVEHRVYSVEIVSGIAMVVLGVIGWVYKNVNN